MRVLIKDFLPDFGTNLCYLRRFLTFVWQNSVLDRMFCLSIKKLEHKAVKIPLISVRLSLTLNMNFPRTLLKQIPWHRDRFLRVLKSFQCWCSPKTPGVSVSCQLHQVITQACPVLIGGTRSVYAGADKNCFRCPPVMRSIREHRPVPSLAGSWCSPRTSPSRIDGVG